MPNLFLFILLARFCEKQYAASWVKDTNLIFIMVSKNCDCLDEMPFNLKPKEVNYILSVSLKWSAISNSSQHVVKSPSSVDKIIFMIFFTLYKSPRTCTTNFLLTCCIQPDSENKHPSIEYFILMTTNILITILRLLLYVFIDCVSL